MAYFEKIQGILHLSEDETFKFCEDVRKMFLEPKPSLNTIFMNILGYAGPRPDPKTVSQKIARQLAEKNKGAQVIKKQSSDKNFFQRIKTNINKRREEPEKSQRVSPDTLRKCPHGVVYYKTCAICNPERFKMENNMD